MGRETILKKKERKDIGNLPDPLHPRLESESGMGDRIEEVRMLGMRKSGSCS